MDQNAFQMPKRLEYNAKTLSPTHGEFHAQPFEKGWATTIGNALRRVLLSSIEGAAVSAIRVEGVLHEFTSVPGVYEDVTDIILNLKQLPVQLQGEMPQMLTLEVKGPKKVTAADIQCPPEVQILDKSLPICTINEEGSLRMEMVVRKGRGYSPADQNFDPALDKGFIPIDAIFSPVKKVRYVVENARLGQSTDYEKLSIEVGTNGVVTPQDALAEASQLLKDHLLLFMNFEVGEEEKPAAAAIPEDANLSDYDRMLLTPIEELELSVRAYNCLKNAEIRNLRDLVQKTEDELLKTKNFGQKTLKEIKALLGEKDLSLGMTL